MERMLDAERLLELRKPFEDLEASAVRMATERPGELHDEALSAIRYVINFAKMLVVRNEVASTWTCRASSRPMPVASVTRSRRTS